MRNSTKHMIMIDVLRDASKMKNAHSIFNEYRFSSYKYQ